VFVYCFFKLQNIDAHLDQLTLNRSIVYTQMGLFLILFLLSVWWVCLTANLQFSLDIAKNIKRLNLLQWQLNSFAAVTYLCLLGFQIQVISIAKVQLKHQAADEQDYESGSESQSPRTLTEETSEAPSLSFRDGSFRELQPDDAQAHLTGDLLHLNQIEFTSELLFSEKLTRNAVQSLRSIMGETELNMCRNLLAVSQRA
jgi:hypothetical protein